MSDRDRQSRVLAVLRRLEEENAERRAFAPDEVGTGADMDEAEAETVLEALVHTGQVETVTAYWPDQGGRGLPPGGRLYALADAGRRSP